MKTIFILCVGACVFCAGYYLGKNDGLYTGAIEYRDCIANGGSGWYVSGESFRCLFD